MEITEVRIKLMEDNNERLLAFCSITLDDEFVIRDLKIIQGNKGCFVAMPSRKLADRCAHCGYKNHLRARHCNQCGTKLDEDRATRDVTGRAKLHADISHPINSRCRERMQNAIIAAYTEEVERSKLPGYRPSYDDFDADYESYDDQELEVLRRTSDPANRAAAAAAGEEAPRRVGYGMRRAG